jgi:hypothetical protein
VAGPRRMSVQSHVIDRDGPLMMCAAGSYPPAAVMWAGTYSRLGQCKVGLTGGHWGPWRGVSKDPFTKNPSVTVGSGHN